MEQILKEIINKEKEDVEEKFREVRNKFKNIDLETNKLFKA